jgi:hypothetical protein
MTIDKHKVIRLLHFEILSLLLSTLDCDVPESIADEYCVAQETKSGHP